MHGRIICCRVSITISVQRTQCDQSAEQGQLHHNDGRDSRERQQLSQHLVHIFVSLRMEFQRSLQNDGKRALKLVRLTKAFLR